MFVAALGIQTQEPTASPQCLDSFVEIVKYLDWERERERERGSSGTLRK